MMASGDERRRQRQLAEDLALGRPTNVIPQYRGSDPELPLRQYVVVEHHEDHLVVRTWDGETEGEQDIIVAKDWLLRRSVFDYTMNGVRKHDRIKYTYDDEQEVHWERIAENNEGLTEQQIINPPYVIEKRTGNKVGSSVICISEVEPPINLWVPEGDDPLETALIHIDDREWSRKYI